MKTRISELNTMDLDAFLRVAGPWFEHSPWVAQRSFAKRPFATLDDLHAKLRETMMSAGREEQVRLIAAHPDLVGKAAEAGTLTAESTREQASAGLGDLNIGERDAFRRYNARYRERFGFPFVICARENKKDAILDALPERLENARDQEIETALGEIGKIARLRMLDAVTED